MDKIDLAEERQHNALFTRVIASQNKIKQEFKYLESVDIKELQSEFVLAQAKEVCGYIARLKFLPFHAWVSVFMATVKSDVSDFCNQFYIKQNEFEEYVPDLDRINSLIITDANEEEFPESRR